ncbi:hypothetical protein PsorP6_005639 [Peronosclerospora sorghi]|uniref:Uncharacterized protein n=1 Tax=Peronosclerospora sorghi TaxID=230839 RepID=A0ACC0W5I0_9STRA|nr:hypothetical protein PsorP6_005639 [Peronosclerospora sorghi]
MEPVRLERQHQVYANHRDDASVTPADQLSAPLAAVHLAETSDFPRLLVALALRPDLAQAADAFGMTALHWVCSDATVSPRVVLTVARAYPEAGGRRNLAGQIPLHLAIRKHLVVDAVHALLSVYPLAIRMRTLPDGKTPLMVATTLPNPSHALLALLHTVANDVAHDARLSKHVEAENEQPRQQREDRAVEAGRRLSTSWNPNETLPTVRTPLILPPTWAVASRCHLCAVKFGYFRKRHHCRNCGASVCGQHSRPRVPLPQFGLFQPTRVCDCCFDALQKQWTGQRAWEGGMRAGEAYPSRTTDTGASRLPSSTSMNRHARHRARSKSVHSEPIPCHGLTESSTEYEYDSETMANGLTRGSTHWNWSAAASEPVQPTMGSMFRFVAPSKHTVVLERQRLLQEQQDPCQGAESITQKSTTKRPTCRPHSFFASDRSLHLERLSLVESSCSSDDSKLDEAMQALMKGHCELGDTVRCSDEEEGWAESETLELADTISETGFFGPLDDEDEEAPVALFGNESSKSKSKHADVVGNTHAQRDVAATHEKVGATLLSKGDLTGAIVALRRCVELDDRNAWAWLQLAKALDSVGSHSEAAEHAVRRALALAPASFGALSLLGKLLHVRGDHEDAIRVFRQALKLQCPSTNAGAPAALEDDDRVRVDE